MSEGTNIEAEIAALSAQIEAKRAQLEQERGSAVESHEVLHHVVGEKVYGEPRPIVPLHATHTSTSTTSYLDGLDPADIEKINILIDMIPKQGIKKTIEQAKNEPAYILDAFHDALVDKLHDELKKQKLI